MKFTPPKNWQFKKIVLSKRSKLSLLCLIIVGAMIGEILVFSGTSNAPGVDKTTVAANSHAEHAAAEHAAETVIPEPIPVTPEAPPIDRAALNLLYSEQMRIGHSSDHLLVTDVRTEAAGDNDRANVILQQMVDNLAKYQDINVAKAEGYSSDSKVGGPTATYHYRNAAVKKSNKIIDPARPNALLYQRASDGSFTFIGVMYIANAAYSVDQINNTLFPLSKSIWHKHLNVCHFASGSAIHGLTEAECASQGGTFAAESNWMTHLFLYKPIAQVEGMDDGDDE